MKKTFVISLLLFSMIGGIAKFVYDEISFLKGQVVSLKTQNKTLLSKQEKIKKALQKKRETFIKNNYEKAKNKIKKASVVAIPYVGTGAIIALTASELESLCNEIKEFKTFEENITGEILEISQEEKAICGYDYESIEKLLMDDLKENYNESSNWLEKEAKKLKNKINSFFENEL